MKKPADAFGRALLDWVQGGTIPEMVERDDGYLEDGAGPEGYLAPFRQWPAAERQSVRYLRGRIADVGCGAGRVAVHLQQRGHDVVGIDASRLAVRSARMTGVREVWCMSADALTRRIGRFDSVILFGNNFGIFGDRLHARDVLTGWARGAPPRARVFVESTNPYCGGAPVMDRAYYRRNQDRGQLPGQTHLRIHYGNSVGPWVPWLFVSRRELRELVRGTGWHVARVVGSLPSEPYVAILEKD
jgi:SAM-dependent methyltransferase